GDADVRGPRPSRRAGRGQGAGSEPLRLPHRVHPRHRPPAGGGQGREGGGRRVASGPAHGTLGGQPPGLGPGKVAGHRPQSLTRTYCSLRLDPAPGRLPTRQGVSTVMISPNPRRVVGPGGRRARASRVGPVTSAKVSSSRSRRAGNMRPVMEEISSAGVLTHSRSIVSTSVLSPA